MRYPRRALRRIQFIVGVVALCGWWCNGAADPTNSLASAVTTELASGLIRDVLDTVAAGKAPDLMPLVVCGPAVIPAIMGALTDAPRDSGKYLLVALRGVGGEPARKALMELGYHAPSGIVRGHALTLLYPMLLPEGDGPREDVAAMMTRSLSALASDEAKSPENLVRDLLDATARGEEPHTFAFSVCGEAAIPAILNALPDASPKASFFLFSALVRIGGDRAATVILDLAMNTPSAAVRERAESAAVVVDGAFLVTEEEGAKIVALVATEPILRVGTWATILSKCDDLAPATRAEPIVKRLQHQLLDPVSFRGLHQGPGCFPTDVAVLYNLARPFARIGYASVPLLRQTQAECEDALYQKWFLVARGFAGDESVTSDVRGIVEDEANEYLRVVALDAYVCVAGQNAIPLLHNYAAKVPHEDHSLDTPRSVEAQLDLSARGALRKMGQDVP